ncbi:hypothetical protein [Tunicatimonas pelagia]|uniref:hypothetical protein n=1 Tax=Tunicatimonas pelagia TaxID=931531 RepID=UPI0026666BEF|nr:hypothetical protein [Tunicatimonas pelagia]WKN45522.1 hypothetical protein P0M28_11195 [Tunicatimonas pelagia]
MKKLLLTAIVALGAVGLACAAPQTAWSAGVIITADEEVLQGEIRYNYAHDIVMYRATTDDNLQTFSTSHLTSFRYYDKKQERVRYFRRYTHQESDYITRPAFFEVVLLGNISYLRKHNGAAYFDPTDSRRFAVKRSERLSPEVMCYDYYVQLNGKIIRARQFKRKVLPWLVNQNIAVKDHMKEHGLRSGYVGDQIRLIRYANARLQSRLSAGIKL